MRRRCTRAGSSWWAQLDVQISLQQSSLSGGGQGCLSTSSPHSTEGVEDAEELPMVGVNHLLVKKTGSLTAHILKQESELEKGLKRCKSCDWSLLLLLFGKCCAMHNRSGGRGALKLLSVTYIHNVSTPILAEFKPFFDNMRGFSHV